MEKRAEEVLLQKKHNRLSPSIYSRTSFTFWSCNGTFIQFWDTLELQSTARL